MDALGIITWFIKATNDVLGIVNIALDFIFLWAGLFVILGYPVYFFIKSTRKYNKEKKNHQENKSGDLLSQTLILVVLAMIAIFFWILPDLTFLVFPKITQKWPVGIQLSTIIRWIEIAIAFLLLARFFGHEYGGKRWLYSSIGHIAVIFFGLFVGRWSGILFISIPIITAYYIALYNLAIILLPASNPEDRVERRMRFNILASYSWGIQSPLIVADGNSWKTPETRIPGDFTWDFSDFPIPIIEKLKWRPGLIWTRSHQVAAITGGTKFKRVEGPGIVFTGALERAEQIFDLRLQLRTNEIDVVSKDGISFKARVFTGFRIDPETWDKELYDKLRPMNALLRGADKPSHTNGSFPYSNLRIQAALGTTSTKAAEGNPTIYWDQWAVNVVEDQARKVISQKDLDELWRPAEDKKFASALDVIAKEIKGNAELTLRAAGILLVVARIVNFRFSDDDGKVDEILEQQLATWGSEWERERTKIVAEAEAEAEHAQQEARAYAEALLLNSIAEGLQKAQKINSHLPRYVIAMRFLSSLQDYIHKHPDEKTTEELQTHFKEWQDQFFPNQGKEKKP